MPVSFLPYSGVAILVMVGILAIGELVKYLRNREQKL
jgi:hypothetical protein